MFSLTDNRSRSTRTPAIQKGYTQLSGGRGVWHCPAMSLSISWLGRWPQEEKGRTSSLPHRAGNLSVPGLLSFHFHHTQHGMCFPEALLRHSKLWASFPTATPLGRALLQSRQIVNETTLKSRRKFQRGDAGAVRTEWVLILLFFFQGIPCST